MKLEEISPRPATIHLASTDRLYKIRPINLSDEIWLNERFGDTLEKCLNEGRIKEIAAIIFHQMEESDKAAFAAQDVTIMNEHGESETMRLGGEKLFFSMVRGPSEKMELYKALLLTLGISQPIVDELEKKSPKAIKKAQKDFGKRR